MSPKIWERMVRESWITLFHSVFRASQDRTCHEERYQIEKFTYGREIEKKTYYKGYRERVDFADLLYCGTGNK